MRPGGRPRTPHLASQIVKIADVYDALVSRRPYKDPFSHHRSIAIIQEGRGGHFDPMVVDAFMDCEEEIRATRERFKDDI